MRKAPKNSIRRSLLIHTERVQLGGVRNSEILT